MPSLETMIAELLGCASVEVAPFVVLEDGGEIAGKTVEQEADAATGRVRRVVRYGDRFVEDWYGAFDGPRSTWLRRLRHLGSDPVGLVETGLRLTLPGPGPDPARDFFYHNENPRIYQRLTIAVDTVRSEDMVADSGFDQLAGNRWADPGTVSERIGAGPYQAFPAMLVGNHATNCGYVHGTLSQQVFFHNYTVGHTAGKLVWTVFASCKAIAARKVLPGEVLDDRFYLAPCDQTDRWDAIFADYTDVLREVLPPLRARGKVNRHDLVWGSWNDGISRKMDQERIFKQAEWLAREMPTVGWVQLDDGYSWRASRIPRAHGLGAIYEEDYGVDREKFPDGLKAYAEGIRQRGLRPAIWIGGFVPEPTPLAQDHPDWFADYQWRVKETWPLDVSQPQVRDYMTHALDVFLLEYGFDAVKQDFWSYAFEESHAILKYGDRTGYEWRKWWLDEFRKRLPNDGYFQTGCDIVMGNPFLAEHFTNYRYGIDIGAGHWDYVLTNALWGAACFILHHGDLFVPNSDSVGLFPGLDDAEALTCLTYCLISRSMVEVAGWLYQNPDHPRLANLRKATCCPDNGADVFFADYDYRIGGDNPAPPDTWYLKSPHFSRLPASPGLPLRTVAVFNWADDEQRFGIDPAALGLDPGRYLATDVWAGTTRMLADYADFPLAPHACVLLGLNAADGGPQLLDANIRIAGIARTPAGLCLEIADRGAFEAVFAAEPAPIPGAEIVPGDGNWRLRLDLAGPTRLDVAF